MKLRWSLLLAIAGVLAFGLLAACGDDDDDTDMDMTDDHTSDMDSDHNDGDDHDSDMGEMSFDREITLQMSDLLRYEPDTITVKVGETIRLVVDNEEGTTLHDFSVEGIPVEDVMSEGAEHHHDDSGSASEFALHVAAEAGEHGVLMFTPTGPGEYEFFCSVIGHREAGMKGTIIVENSGANRSR